MTTHSPQQHPCPAAPPPRWRGAQHRGRIVVGLLGLALMLLACSSYRWADPRPGMRQRGMASWYGQDFHGKPTASGEIYDMHGLSAAHRQLPLGTRVEVTNLENGRRVTVTVNDRGPFVRGRIIDMSYGAAQALGMVNAGLARVEVHILEVGQRRTHTRPGDRYTVQVGAFRIPENAEDLRRRLGDDHGPVAIEAGPDGLLRVRVGAFTQRRDAEQLKKQLRRAGFRGVVVVAGQRR